MWSHGLVHEAASDLPESPEPSHESATLSRNRGNTWQRILPRPGNPGHSCCHITFMRLARIQRVKTAPSRIRAASSNPAHAPHRESCGQPVSGIHARWRGHSAATEIPTDRRSGRRGNRRSYHAPAIKEGAGEPSPSSAPLASSHPPHEEETPPRRLQPAPPERRPAGSRAGLAPPSRAGQPPRRLLPRISR